MRRRAARDARAWLWAMAVFSAAAAGLVPAVRAQQVEPPCGRAGRPWVTVAFRGEAWDADERSAVLADLRAGLALKGIDACAFGSAGSERPLAVLELVAAEPARVGVGIEVHDALTEKRVLRDLDLRTVASDARALAIAAAADELLRASWAELALEDAPPPSRPPPSEVEQSLRASMVKSRVVGHDRGAGFRAVVEHHGGGLTLVGGDVYVALWPAQRLGFELGLGLREGLTQHAEYGAIESRALCGSFDLAFALLPRGERFGLLAKLGTALTSVRMRGAGDGAGDAQAAEGAGVDVHARVGFAFTYAPIDWLGLRADLGAGGALRGVDATEGGRPVTGTSGLELRGGLGAEVYF